LFSYTTSFYYFSTVAEAIIKKGIIIFKKGLKEFIASLNAKDIKKALSVIWNIQKRYGEQEGIIKQIVSVEKQSLGKRKRVAYI